MQVPLEFDYVTRRRSFDELGEVARRSGDPRMAAAAGSEHLWRAFPRGYVGAWLQDRLIGCIHIRPLDGRRTGDFLVGARSERELTAEDLSAVCSSGRTVWFFSGLVLAPEWRGRGLGAHLFAEAMTRWHRDLPWRPPLRFAALGSSEEGLGFVVGFGMELVRPGDETVDGHPLFTRTVGTEEELLEIVRGARAAADRKGRIMTTV